MSDDAPVFMLANLVVQDATEYRKYEKGPERVSVRNRAAPGISLL
jgi:hypothetical protein